jgi:hypoxanthine phosphoribosyltransferase
MDKFRFISRIISFHEAFRGKEKQLEEIFEICDDKQKKLLIELFRRFYNITEEDYKNFRASIAESILNNGDLLANKLLISSLVLDSKPDSGDSAVYSLKIQLAKELRKIQFDKPTFDPDYEFTGPLNKSIRKLNQNKKITFNLVLVDEFLGSGKTLRHRLDLLSKVDHQNIGEIHVFHYAGMKYALDDIITKYPEIKIHTYRPLIKGISETFPSTKVNENLDLMLDLEKNLADSPKGKKVDEFSLGYEQSESLYNNDLLGGNIPNNVFPIFWWPYDSNAKLRHCLFLRDQEGV